MWNGWVVGLAGCALILSGCAGAQTRQGVARLQSQVGLLEERVTQLERSVTMGPGMPLSHETAPTDFRISAEQPVQPTTVRSSGKSPAAKTSLKPSTREIQQALKNAGFYQGAIDGKRGPMTREAVKEFQRLHGLSDDGVVGKQTWAKLSAYEDLSAGSGEATAAEVLK